MENAGKEIEVFGELLDKTIAGHKNIQTHWVKVSQVDWDTKTMTAVGLADDLEFYNVLLGLGAFYIKPKVGAKALIGMLMDSKAASFLIQAEAIEQYDISIGDNHKVTIDTEKYMLDLNNTKLLIDAEGFLLQRNNETLKKVLNDWQVQFGKLCDEINKIVVSIGVTPNIAAITQIKNTVTTDLQQRLNNVLK